MNRHETHPSWCGQGHVCSAHRPGGEHRSHPITVDTATARLVATRIQTVAGVDRLEIRTVVDLPADPDQARQAAQQVMQRVHQAVKARRVGGGR